MGSCLKAYHARYEIFPIREQNETKLEVSKHFRPNTHTQTHSSTFDDEFRFVRFSVGVLGLTGGFPRSLPSHVCAVCGLAIFSHLPHNRTSDNVENTISHSHLLQSHPIRSDSMCATTTTTTAKTTHRFCMKGSILYVLLKETTPYSTPRTQSHWTVADGWING